MQRLSNVKSAIKLVVFTSIPVFSLAYKLGGNDTS